MFDTGLAAFYTRRTRNRIGTNGAFNANSKRLEKQRQIVINLDLVINLALGAKCARTATS